MKSYKDTIIMDHKQMIVIFLTLCISVCIYCKPAKKDGVDDTSFDRKTTKRLGKYFSTYGYTASYTENVNDIRASIKKFQKFAGLLITGQLDKPTSELLEKDRCGMKDPLKTRRVKRYNKAGSWWKNKTLTWRYKHDGNLDNPKRLGEDEIRSVMKRAMSLWEAKTNIEFVEDRSANEPDVWVRFARRRHEDPFAFDGPGGTLAHAFYPMENKGLAGDIHFDDDEHFFIKDSKSGEKSLYWVAVHELGHTLGLDHSRTQTAIMFPFYPKGRRDIKLDYDDILGIQKIYGGKRGSEKPDKEIPLNKRCPAGKVTAMYDSEQGDEYMLMTDDEKIYTVDKNGGGIKQSNVDAKSYYGSILGKIDAVLQTSSIDKIIFSGKNYYLYEGIEYKSGPHPLNKLGLPDQPEKIDGAMKWWLNNKIYLFSGEKYWRLNEATMKADLGYPQLIRNGWKKLPGKVDSAFSSDKTKETIFTIGDQIYRIQERPWPATVKAEYPRSIKTDLLDCEDI